MSVDHLSEESLRHVEAGAAAHRTVVELAARLQAQLAETEHELKSTHLELDHLKIAHHDLQERAWIAEQTCAKAVETKVAYETLVRLLATSIAEFVTPVQQARSAPPPVTLTDDTVTGAVRIRPQPEPPANEVNGSAPARYRLPGVER